MKKFIKQHWMPLAIILGSLVILVIKLAQLEFAFSFIALTLLLVAAKNLLLELEQDELRESYNDLIVAYIKELNSNLDFIKSSRSKLADIILDVNKIKEEPVVTPKKKTTKKTKKA